MRRRRLPIDAHGAAGAQNLSSPGATMPASEGTSAPAGPAPRAARWARPGGRAGCRAQRGFVGTWGTPKKLIAVLQSDFYAPEFSNWRAARSPDKLVRWRKHRS